MRQILVVRRKYPGSPGQLIVAMVLCLVIPDLFAESAITSRMESGAESGAESGIDSTVHYAWVKNSVSPCAPAAADRLMRPGFAADWHQLEVCENPRNLWWVLALKPKLKSSPRTKRTAVNPDESDVVFEFKSDFGTRLTRLVTERYTGPPKWMPPKLAYWDPYIGDWRYRRTNLNDHIYEDKAGSELMMFWVKYEHYEDGIIWDTSFDFSRLLDVLDVSLFRMSGLTAKILDILKGNTE